MPLLKSLGGRGWKYGPHGKSYTGADAKQKAIRHGLTEIGKKSNNADEVDATINVEITKHDVDRQLVFGWANVSMAGGELVVDSHGDTISVEELENAAYAFNLSYNSEATGEMHMGEAKGRLVESFMVTPEKLEKMGLATDALPLGWWVGMYVEDKDLFEKVKSGKYRAMSIQGVAQRIKN